ncbi:MAG: reverse transcriptase-like protein [Patescibacteria group bacterium]
MKNNLIIYTDGGARGNPGPAAIGYVVFVIKKGETLHELMRKGEAIGIATNNQAEYRALIAALEYILTLHPDALEVRLDSELVGKQLRGEYRVKDKDLKPLYAQVTKLAQRVAHMTYTIIPRELNKDADREVNKALDAI